MYTLSMLAAAIAFVADGDRALKVATSRFLPKIEAVSVYRSKDADDGNARSDEPLVRSDAPSEDIALPDEGPFEVYVKPKGGMPVKVAGRLTAKSGTTTVKLADVLGTVEVVGDNFPRAAAIVLTATDDPGPGEKGHLALQTAKEYRSDMAVRAGTYAVWVKPINGARPQRVSDNVRVAAGRSVRVE